MSYDCHCSDESISKLYECECSINSNSIDSSICDTSMTDYDSKIICKKPDNCKSPNFVPLFKPNLKIRCISNALRIKLGEIRSKQPQNKCPPDNGDERRYKCKAFAGSFSKGLLHDSITGTLLHPEQYAQMADSIVKGNQKLLSNVPLAPQHEVGLIDPLASLSRVLAGADFCALKLPVPPALCSDSLAAELIELYAMMVSRDVAFIDYSDNDTIQTTVLEALNQQSVLKALPYHDADIPFTTQTVFRAEFNGETFGPYVSQFVLLDIPYGAQTILQKYNVPQTSAEVQASGDGRNEWGVINTETALQQNTYFSQLPDAASLASETKYIYSGRALAELVHHDQIIQLAYNTALILNKLQIPLDPGLPTASNQVPFVTDGGLADIVTGVAKVTELALQHAFYWKWQINRRARPEVFGLWVDNVKQMRVSNDVYHLSNLILDSSILTSVNEVNLSWFTDPDFNSYTLNTSYKEGSPTHPAYPAGHAVFAGATMTYLKMMYFTELSWQATGQTLKQPDSTGDNLVDYDNSDAQYVTINSELNKMVMNIFNGRNFAGIHYRTDGIGGALLGEQVAINYVQDQLDTYFQRFPNGKRPRVTLEKFNGQKITVKGTIRSRCTSKTD